MVTLVRGDLTPLQRIMLGALIVIDVHARTVVTNMIEAKINNVNSFEWQKQLRYYWEAVESEEEGEGDKDADATMDEDSMEMDVFARQTNT